MGTYADAAQTAVVDVLAVVSAAGDSALDGVVRGAAAAVIGVLGVHSSFLRKIKVSRQKCLLIFNCQTLAKN